MHLIELGLEHAAPSPFLPIISLVAVVVGVVLILGPKRLGFANPWVRPAAFPAARDPGVSEPHFHLPADEKARSGSQTRVGGFFLTALWFGQVAGWLELALVLAQRTLNPHISVDAFRTNRHFVWMILVADVLIFGFVGLAMQLFAKLQPRATRWLASRLPVGLTVLTLLLTVEGLHPIAGAVLACGVASVIAPLLEGRAAAVFGRLVRVTFPVMAVGLIVLTVQTYKQVTSGEHLSLSVRPPAKPGAPNVLLIVLDTVRAASMSLYGHSRPTAPNLERLARKGIVFLEARSTASWTLPSHASMMTGRWPHELSVGWDRALDGTFPTLAEVLGREGYATAGFVGNVYYCSSRYGVSRGLARYVASYENQTVSLFEIVRSSGVGKRLIQALGYPIRLEDGETSVRKTAAMLNRDVLGWLANRPLDRPFFVFVNYYDAHRPHLLHGDPSHRFGIAALPLDKQAEIKRRFLEHAGKRTPADLTHRRIVNEGFQRYHDRYDSSIAYLDRQVGLLLDEIERRGLLKNTLVIVTSDHGEQLGEHGVIAHGASLYRPEVHVPLLVIPPSELSSPRIVNEPVSLRDIPATVAEWVDLRPRNPFPGSSLASFRRTGSEQRPQPSPVRCEVQHNTALPRTSQIPSSGGAVTSLLSRDRVYIRSDSGREELYDLLHDPMEAVDLSAYPESRPVIERFREQLGRLGGDMTTPAR